MHTRSVYNTIDGKKVWKTEVTLIDHCQYDGGPFDFGATYEDGTLNRVIGSLIAIRESIPEQYRDEARCHIDSESGYEGDHSAHIVVKYYRPETPAETEARIAKERRAEHEKREQELAKLAALKAKYEA